MKVESIYDVEEIERLDRLTPSASLSGAFRSLAMAWAKLRVAAGMPSSASTFCDIVEEDIVIVSMILRDMFPSTDAKRIVVTVDRLWDWASKLSQDSIDSTISDDPTIGELTGSDGSGPVTPTYIVALTPVGVEIMVGFGETIMHSGIIHTIASSSGSAGRRREIEEDSTAVIDMYVESYKNATFGDDDE
jgi:hypothetical protein